MTVNLKAALQSDALVALHIKSICRNGGENISVNVPVQNIVAPRNIGGDLDDAVLISNLRQCAVTALLENQPREPLPAHLLKCFELSSYLSKDGITLSIVDNTLSQVLESSVSMRKHGDEGVVLHIFCAFSNRCQSSYVRTNACKLRASAAAAGARERKRLATNLTGWASNKKRVVEDNVGIRKEYVAVPYAINPHPLRRLRDHVVDSIVPEGMDEKDFFQKKADEAFHFAETAVNYLIEGAIRTSEKLCHRTSPNRYEPFSDAVVVPPEEFKENEDFQKSAIGVEIMLESDDYTTPSPEWNVIFDLNMSSDDSMGSMIGSVISLDSGAAVNSVSHDIVADSSEDSKINSPENSIIEIDTDILQSDLIESCPKSDTPKDVPAIDNPVNNLLSESGDDGLLINLDVVKSYSSSESSTPKVKSTSDENLSFDSRLSSFGGISIDDDNSWTVLDKENGI